MAEGDCVTQRLFKCSKLHYSVSVDAQLELGTICRRCDRVLNSLSVSLSQDESLEFTEE